MSRIASATVTLLLAALVAAAVALAQMSSAEAAGRSGGDKLSKGQKTALVGSAKLKLSRCNSQAGKRKLHFAARRAFINACMAK
jgi:hypothetical protein